MRPSSSTIVLETRPVSFDSEHIARRALLHPEGGGEQDVEGH